MITRRHRFHGQASLRYVYKYGQPTRGPWFLLKTAHNPRAQEWRLAVVISRKVVKSAVKRNRVRRRLFEAVRQLSPQFAEPRDIVISVFTHTILEAPASELVTQLKRQLRQAGVI